MHFLRPLRFCIPAAVWLSFVLSARPAPAQEPAPIPYDHNPAAGKFYDINGFKMYTEVYGSGPPLLMIHGNNGDMSAFAKNVPYFATHYQVILADSRSQGRSLDPGHPLTFEMMADDYAALLDAMHIPSAYIIGWSDGGINALLLAIRHPEKVKRLASAAPTYGRRPMRFSRDSGTGKKGVRLWPTVKIEGEPT